MKVDFFSRKHKSIRARLFETSDFIGRTDWTDDDDVKALLGAVATLDAELRTHGGHEDHYIMPLLKEGAPDLFEEMEEDHEIDIARRAQLLRVAHLAAATRPEHRAETALGFYRAFNRYVAAYLMHLDAEETRVMPMLHATVSELRLADTLAAFITQVASKQPLEDTAHMAAHLPPRDRAALLGGVRAVAPPAVFQALLSLVVPQLTAAERDRFDRDLAA